MRPRVVLRYANNNKLAQRAAAVDACLGQGHVVVFSDNPFWRAGLFRGTCFSLSSERSSPWPASTPPTDFSGCFLLLRRGVPSGTKPKKLPRLPTTGLFRGWLEPAADR